MIALAADELYMGPTATLGPIDTHYWGFPADAWKQLKKGAETDKRPIESDTMYMLAYLAEKRARDENKRSARPAEHEVQEARPTRSSRALTDPAHHGERFTLERAQEGTGHRRAARRCAPTSTSSSI